MDSKGILKASSKPGGGVQFIDLAAFTLKIAQTGEFVREAPYIAY